MNFNWKLSFLGQASLGLTYPELNTVLSKAAYRDGSFNLTESLDQATLLQAFVFRLVWP